MKYGYPSGLLWRHGRDHGEGVKSQFCPCCWWVLRSKIIVLLLMWSIIIGAVGVFATLAAVVYLARRVPDWAPQHFWFLGLAGLFPAWLSAFLGLLQPLAEGAADIPLPPRALFSSGAALCGVIVTDYLLRRLQKSGRALRPVTCWIIGLAALLPAWCIALVRI